MVVFTSSRQAADPASAARIRTELAACTVNGDFLWKADLGRVSVGAIGFPPIEWGPAGSPIIWNDLVILQVDTQTDSFVVA